MNLRAGPDWLLLVISLPTSSATGRMRIWRALKALGCVALRDGAYLLPAGPGRAEALRELGDECEREGGSAWLMTVIPDSADDDAAYRQLFDRSEQYAELRKSWKSENRALRSLSMTELTRLKRRLEKELDALRAIDFFPSEASVEAEAAWVDFSKRIDALLSPDEPHETAGTGAEARRRRVPRPDLGDAAPPLGRPGGERLADPPVHRPRRQVPLARQALRLPEERARLRLRRRDLHARRRSRHLRNADGELRPRGRPRPRAPGERSFTRSTSAASRFPRRSASRRSWPERANGSATTTRCWPR